MPKSPNQKLKILYLAKIFAERTDVEHPMTMPEIIRALDAYGVEAERKSLYDDFSALRRYGFSVESCQSGKATGYYLEERQFELPELKLLVDAVASSKFITRKKSEDLIAKIASLTSVHEARQLSRQVYVANRGKTMNEKVYYAVDSVHRAILEDSSITFRYYDWNVKKEKVFRHDGALYTVSPYALTWDDEKYYLIAYDHNAQRVRHYRVDKLDSVKVTGKTREGKRELEGVDMAIYEKRCFGMFSGEPQLVSLLCDHSVIGAMIDRFGEDITIIERKDQFEIHVEVVTSPVFYSFVMSFGGRVRILAPLEVRSEIEKTAEKILTVHQSIDEQER
ncbi:MAG: WYL domain-containing protein [Clostridia bacterium]|nr:WYL domain-containing protein [Clostridia bacterium]